MQNIKHIELNSFIRDKVQDHSIVKNIVSIGLGIAVARQMALSSQAVEDCTAYYEDAVAKVAQSMITVFNEDMVIDIDLAIQTARQFWVMRYVNAYPPRVIPLNSEEITFMKKLNETSFMCNPETEGLCDAYPDVMIATINKITDIILPS